jgi:hypothetical protein
MASVAQGGVMSKRRNLSDLMPKGGMAGRAFDLVISDMLFMHQLGGILRTQYHGLIMAFNAFPFGDMGITLNHVEMALLAGYPSGNILTVIKTPTLDLNVSLRLNVTRGASAYGT